MFDFVTELAVTPVQAAFIYLIAGLVFFYGDKRIRWYAFSLAWVGFGQFDRGMFIETCVLGFAFMLSESFFKMYSENFAAKSKAPAEDKE